MTAVVLAFLLGIATARGPDATTGGHEDDVGQMVMGAGAIRTFERPRWVVHRVTPRERISQIAARYGVRLEQVLEWNDMAEPIELREGTKLRIRTRRVPAPRRRIEVEVDEGQQWRDIMRAHRVEYRDLRAYNWDKRELTAGTKLVVWVDPALERTVNVVRGPAGPDRFEVALHGRSIGKPQRGRIENAVQLPDSPLYTRRHGAAVWGSSHTINHLMEAIANLRHRSGYAGEIVIGSISRQRGGRFPPHLSHQSGRDVDIRLPLLPGVPDTVFPNPDEIDWAAAWELISALVETGEVSVIFLEIELQRRVYQGALWEGVEPEALRTILQWPTTSGRPRAIVRHSKGHDGHLHVRFRCSRDEPRCRGR